LEDVSISSAEGVIHPYSLIIIDSGIVSLIGCTFSNIVISSSIGGVINSVVDNLSVRSCFFDGCGCKNSNAAKGGAIYCELKSEGVLIIEGTDESPTKFKNCMAQNAEGVSTGLGGGVFLRLNNNFGSFVFEGSLLFDNNKAGR
jgi:hypothetical protein